MPDKEDLEEREAILIAPLNTENYKDKFHDLLYWEELEHEEILSERYNKWVLRMYVQVIAHTEARTVATV